MFQLPPLDEVDPPELASVKCTKCDAVTDHEYVKINPVVDDLANLDAAGITPVEFMKMSKRLSICTNCGTLRLTN